MFSFLVRGLNIGKHAPPLDQRGKYGEKRKILTEYKNPTGENILYTLYL
jgi:hypothetical protein